MSTLYHEMRYPCYKHFDFTSLNDWRWKALDAAENFRTDLAVTDEAYDMVQVVIASAADALTGWEQLYRLRTRAHQAVLENPSITPAELVEVVRAVGLDLA